MLLLIRNVMFGASNDTSLLDTLDGLVYTNTREHRVRRETFPIAAPSGVSADGSDGRTKLDVNALLAVLDAHVGYYLDRNLVERVESAVIAPARRAGCRRTWMLGISLGGLGALLCARAIPEVERVILLAPSALKKPRPKLSKGGVGRGKEPAVVISE